MGVRRPFVHEAVLHLHDRTDPRAPGGAVTVALCGHWEHEGACPWPHNSRISREGASATLRTVFAAPPEEEEDVRSRIELAPRSDSGWTVSSSGGGSLQSDEYELAAELTKEPLDEAPDG